MRWKLFVFSIAFVGLLHLPKPTFANEPEIAGSLATGDVTLLTFYDVPLSDKQAFEAGLKAAAQRSIEMGKNIWLLYDEVAIEKNRARYLTVHFPHSLNELTEPNSAPYELVSAFGHYRDGAELTRQVPDWCSTTNVDPYLLAYAFVDYLWLTPNSLDEAGRLLAKRGEILRDVYGTESKGNTAAEGFVSMVAPAQLMLVIFSKESQESEAIRVLEADLEERGRLREWRSLHKEFDLLVTKHSKRANKFRPELSADGD